MSIKELLEIIQRSKFQDLLDKHRFKLVYKKHESRGGIQDSYSVGFESTTCKLGFHCEATIGAAMLAKSSDWEKGIWIDLETVVAYLLRRPISQFNMETERLDKYTSYGEKLTNILSKRAADVEPLFKQIVTMFEDEDTIARWRPELEQYVREDTWRRHGDR